MCNRNKNKIVSILAATILAVIIALAISAGYGAGHSAMSQQAWLAKHQVKYQPSQVDVIYERSLSGKQDFLHLQIDTTYHAIGKGNYTHKMMCRRDYSLRAFDGEYHDCSDVVAKCFTEGENTLQWHKVKTSRPIVGYDCQMALVKSGEHIWQAWYTDQLPHICNEATATDDLKGLILELSDKENRYHLKAKYITQYIG